MLKRILLNYRYPGTAVAGSMICDEADIKGWERFWKGQGYAVSTKPIELKRP